MVVEEEDLCEIMCGAKVHPINYQATIAGVKEKRFEGGVDRRGRLRDGLCVELECD